jgi:dTMP kinase
MDRYTYCQYALLRARGDRGEHCMRRLYGCIPRPNLVYLLSVPALTAHRRVELRGRDREDPAYLAAFEAAYRSLPEFASFRMIDASGDPAAVQQALQTAVISDPTLASEPSVAQP